MGTIRQAELPSDASLGARRPPSLLKALDRVLSRAGFPYGSNCLLFREAQFGRDALEVAEDLLEMRPAIARAVIRRLAALQGTMVDPRTEEEPGKIHHEHRALVMEGQPVGQESAAIFRELAQQWELDQTEDELSPLQELTTYMTVDATPLYVRLVSEYCKLYGGDILQEEYTPRRWAEGSPKPTIRDSVSKAVDWITSRIERSDTGLLEFQRMTPHGHHFQAWKDGGSSYLHPDGSYCNYDAPIASIEVQGLAYDALRAAPSLVGDVPQELHQRWTALAERVQQTVIRLFWMPDERYFAMAIDRDPRTGRARQMKLISSNPGALLDSSLFDTLDPQGRLGYVAAIVERVCSGEFLTPVGIRCSSLVHENLLGYPAYQSSHTVWHKETYDIAKGFLRQGFPKLARNLENRLLNAINVTGGATEFLYVLSDNRVDYDPLNRVAREDAEEIVATNVPENDQAWSISAGLAVKWRRGSRQPPRPLSITWGTDLEDRLLNRITPVELLRTVSEIEQAFPTDYSFRINTRKGWEREGAYARRHHP
jgi:glycogen debranching enzyme